MPIGAPRFAKVEAGIANSDEGWFADWRNRLADDKRRKRSETAGGVR